MPMASKAQNAAMHAAASGNSNIGIPKSVGAKFVAEQHGHPLPKGTPKKVAPAKSNHRTTRASNSPFALKKKPPVDEMDDSGM